MEVVTGRSYTKPCVGLLLWFNTYHPCQKWRQTATVRRPSYNIIGSGFDASAPCHAQQAAILFSFFSFIV